VTVRTGPARSSARELLADLRAFVAWEGELDALAARVEKVLALHSPGPFYDAERSDGESVTKRLCRQCSVNFPCPTVRLLNGEDR
jgi:hypothetical protein